MPLPTISDQHVDSYLTNLSVGWIQEPSNFVASDAFANLPVDKKSDRIPLYNRGDLYRDEMQIRAPGTESAGGGYRVSRDTYLADVYATHIDVDEQTIAGADNPYAPAEDALRVVVQRERLKREVQFGTEAFATSIWTGGTSSDPSATTAFGAALDDPSSSPIEGFAEQANSILVKTGFAPNALVLNNLGWISLKNHPDVVDRVKHTSGAPVSMDIVARLLDLDNIYVSKATRNTAAEGITASYSSILGNSALLYYRNPSAGLWSPSAGYTFVWRGYPGSTDGRRVKRFHLDKEAAWRIEGEAAFDIKSIDADLGCFITSVAS